MHIYEQNIPPECQTVWIKIKPDVSSGLICIQTVRKVNNQRMTKLVSKPIVLLSSRTRVKQLEVKHL